MANRYTFNGLGLGLGNVSRLSNAKTRSISAENFTGAKGRGGMARDGTGAEAARDLGPGWKISPSIAIAPQSTATLADIQGPGALLHIWLTTRPSNWRRLIVRAYWDREASPSIETPYGDFFAQGWCERANVNSLPIAVNPAGGFNSYWEMPFHEHARLTIENLGAEEIILYYQIGYTLTALPADVAYFHAHWRRSNPLGYQEVHTLVDNIRGKGHYVGTYLAWQTTSPGWWGEGEIKFYLDGDQDFPTICGTGTEDYFGGAWNFEQPPGEYCPFSTAFLGLPQVIRPDGCSHSQQRFGMYRWHIMDPIRFEADLRVTIQALGRRPDRRYVPRQDDIASTAFWYQAEPHVPYPPLPDADELEVSERVALGERR